MVPIYIKYNPSVVSPARVHDKNMRCERKRQDRNCIHYYYIILYHNFSQFIKSDLSDQFKSK